MIIQMAGVSKLYQNGVSALQDINVSIEKGEFVFLIGQSGAGKTTFIRLLFGLLPQIGRGRSIIRKAARRYPY